LLEELDTAETCKYPPKYSADSPFISIGLANDDILLTEWNVTVIPQQGCPVGDRMYGVQIHAGLPKNHPKDEFPIKPPVVRFVHKVALSCVDSKGYVDVAKIPNFSWSKTPAFMPLLSKLRATISSNGNACARITDGAKY
jgi:ubiquitin-protein ligase